MFTSEWREKTRQEILEAAKSDSRISGGAITGSGSVGQLDSWSDIDLAFGVRDAAEISAVLDTYTKRMYEEYQALHHLDVKSGAWIYRVFLLANTLQVDLAFAPQEQFGARANTFKLVFGKTGNISHDPTTPLEVYAGWVWLYALHVRSSLKRGRLWQAEFFVSGMRDYLISIACRRHRVLEYQGRGVDKLPPEELKKFEPTLVRSMDLPELERVFSALVKLYLEEMASLDMALYSRIVAALNELASKAS